MGELLAPRSQIQIYLAKSLQEVSGFFLMGRELLAPTKVKIQIYLLLLLLLLLILLL